LKWQGPSQEATFLAIRWIGVQKTVPESVLAKIQSIQAPSDKTVLQVLLKTFGLWRSHISGFSILRGSL